MNYIVIIAALTRVENVLKWFLLIWLVSAEIIFPTSIRMITWGAHTIFLWCKSYVSWNCKPFNPKIELNLFSFKNTAWIDTFHLLGTAAYIPLSLDKVILNADLQPLDEAKWKENILRWEQCVAVITSFSNPNFHFPIIENFPAESHIQFRMHLFSLKTLLHTHFE